MTISPRALILTWSARAFALALVVFLAACGPETKTTATRKAMSVDEIAADYRATALKAHEYAIHCKTARSDIRCDSRLVSQITVASDQAWSSIEAAQTAQNNRAPTSDRARVDAQRRLDYLHEFTNKIPTTQKRPHQAL